MYRNKLFIFGLLFVLTLVIVMAAAVFSAHITGNNLKQNTTAQQLLTEHQQLSSISYRLFKQLTDELIFGKNANQAEIRNKQELISESLAKITRLEIQQREALGPALTEGSVEDTESLAQLIASIVREFEDIVAMQDDAPLNQQERVQRLLEVTIDAQFRDAINAAVARQSTVVAAINTKIEMLNRSIIWFAIGIGLVGIPLILLSCLWLFNQLYQPLLTIKTGTEALAEGRYDHRLPDTLDYEFRQLAQAFNSMAEQLWQHEQRSKQSRAQLETEVQQRTQELVLANQRLTEIDNKRRQFLADVSHELRTPITIIRGEAQVTLRQANSDAQVTTQALQMILQQAVGLSRLIDDLLLLARAETSQLKLEIAPVNVATWLHTQLALWQKHATEHQLEAQVEVADARVDIDEERMAQVFGILLDNAIKYTPSGSLIRVSAYASPQQVDITIHDSGPGIAPNELPYVFERFVRFQRQTEGSGLGLAIAKAIVTAHHGRLHVSSEQNQGSAFTITLNRTIS